MHPHPKRSRGSGAATPGDSRRKQSDSLVVLSTNDTHSRCDTFKGLVDASARERMGLAGGCSLWCDAGDWFSGTVYTPLGPNPECPEVPELQHFVDAGIVATIGNHEFDATAEGFVNMIAKAHAAFPALRLVSSDLIVTDDSSNCGRRLAPMLSDNIDAPSIINASLLVTATAPSSSNDVAGMPVGVLGFMGPDARTGCRANVEGTGVGFLPWRSALSRGAELAHELRQRGARIVIALVHGGMAESMQVRRAVGCDLILSGHTHERIVASCSTPVVQAEAYGSALGVTKLELHRDGSVVVVDSRIVVVEPPSKHHHHPSFARCVEPLFRSLGVDSLCAPISLRGLPREATTPITRADDDVFTGWLCTAVLEELNHLLPRGEPRLHGFFIANELVRGDLVTGSPSSSQISTTTSELVSLLEVGQASPRSLGIDIVAIETTRHKLRLLRLAFWIATRVYTENARLSYSNGMFDAPVGGDASMVRVATTAFMASYLCVLPSFVFDARRVVREFPTTALSLLVRTNILRNSGTKNRSNGGGPQERD